MLVTHRRSKTTKNYATNEIGMREKTLSESKINFSRLRSVLKGYVKATYCPKMIRIAKMKCSAVVDWRVAVLAVQALKVERFGEKDN